MNIKALKESIQAKSILNENGGIRIVLEGAVTDAQLLALQSGMLDIDDGYTMYSGYTSLKEHSVLLGNPGADELADMKAALEKLGLRKETTWADAAAEIVEVKQ
jgi:hypothetical protein